MLTRTDWLLRFIAGPENYDGWIDSIRVMKGIFLFQEETDAPRAINYKFRPYDYGPFTKEIYRDLEALMEEGYVVQSTGDSNYRVTQHGRDYLNTLEFPEKPLEELMGLRIEVSELGFRDLLKRVYIAHPASARRSVAKDVLD